MRHWLISKAEIDCTIDSDVFSVNNDGEKIISRSSYVWKI